MVSYGWEGWIWSHFRKLLLRVTPRIPLRTAWYGLQDVSSQKICFEGTNVVKKKIFLGSCALPRASWKVLIGLYMSLLLPPPFFGKIGRCCSCGHFSLPPPPSPLIPSCRAKRKGHHLFRLVSSCTSWETIFCTSWGSILCFQIAP